MSSRAPPSLMQAVLDGPLPNFVELPGRFRCVVCNDVLKDPWQTDCGHRMCASCLHRTFEMAAEVMCPALDEDCAMISKDRVSISCWIHKVISLYESYIVYTIIV